MRLRGVKPEGLDVIAVKNKPMKNGPIIGIGHSATDEYSLIMGVQATFFDRRKYDHVFVYIIAT